jgi:MFS family permease
MAAKDLLVQPPPLRSQSVAGQFDAKRAKARLAFVLGDQRPHPADSPANDQVRARIVAELSGMGVKPIVRDQLACNDLFKQRGVSCARVRNVIAVLGPQRGRALLLNAHYDSTPVGPGAADDGAGVATLLELGEILKQRQLKRPVILLFNEGEELGLVGARAFLEDPLSRSVDSLINLEARGVRGPVNMFETSRPNRAPIGLFQHVVSRPLANSLSTDVYRLMPNYTDVNSFAERDWLTLNLAPIGNETRYHSPGDDLAALDPATLQHMGDQTLALATSLADGRPSASDGDRMFMDVAGRALIALPLALGVLLLALLLVIFAGMAHSRRALVRGGAVVIGTLAGSAVVAWLALALIGALRDGIFWRAHPIWTLLAIYALVMLVAVALLATIGRPARIRQLRVAFWLVFLVIGVGIGALAPGGIIFFLFPPLLMLLGRFAARWWRPAATLGSAAAILCLYCTWGAMLGLLEELLNNGPMWLFAPLGALLILPVLIEAKPLIDAVPPRTAAVTAAIIAFVGWIAAAASPAYSADRQQRFVIQHVTDADNHRYRWSVLNDSAPLPEAFGAGNDWARGRLPFSGRPRWLARAPADPTVKAPDVQFVSETRSGNERVLTVRLVANGAQRVELIAPPSAKITAAGLPGDARPVDQIESGRYYIQCYGRSCDGLTLEVRIGQIIPIEFVVLGGRERLPASAAPLLAARPKFARAQYDRDESLVFTRRSL